ncbi:gamma-secretase-activating protein isoform X2 [Myripristis murdjan]|uniref:gamma-secretase-activating protein isoform X2 n=1 Tax=Myripristis murdjan TaxID=586833 RepID=UPI001175D3D6|nr:gamma-secretase-activating protein isoform X2 [Myripristis murdjan]
MLKLKPKFDLHRDVVSDLLRKEASLCRVKDEAASTFSLSGVSAEYSGPVDTCILNIERGGGILYSWKGATGTTKIGKYDPNTKQNKLLYTFDQQVCVSSCSLNKEETLLAVSLAQRTKGQERLRPMSKCLTLLIEIHPINNTKVLKAVDCRVRVQFLYPETDRSSVLESHLLLLTEDGYVDQYHILLTKQEGYRVVVVNPDRLSKAVERVVEDFSWVQWDGHTQRLYYLTHREKSVLHCVQFYPNHNCETVLELQLELPANPFSKVTFVNLGFDHYHAVRPEQELIRMEVFTNRIGSMCVCWSHAPHDIQELTYTLVLVHKGCSKMFKVSLDSGGSCLKAKQLHPLFIPMGYYILVCLQGYFLHCINTRQQEMLCHSLFLSGRDAVLGPEGELTCASVLGGEEETGTALLDLSSGKICTAELCPAFLLQILRADTPSCAARTDRQRLAALHCLLVYMGNDPNLELKIIDWLCDSVTAFGSFDHIQEFILASLYRISYDKSLGLDKVLPYSSVFDKKEIPMCLLEVPGVSCTTELHTEPVFRGKARGLQGFWSELQWNTEKMKYLEAVPNPRYRTSYIQADWDKLRSETRSSSSHPKHLEENTKKVLSVVDTWSLDKKLVPLFQEEDHQQRALIGLMVDKLREHLNRHLPRLGKKKIDSLVVSYVAKLLELIRHMLESVWLKYKLGPHVLCLTQQGSSAEWAVFHFMLRILEATRGLCLPLPPGYHTLLAVLGVRCLPHQTFLQYIDHGLLQLSETFVSRLMTALDNSDANEKLKFSILKRLPEPMEQRIYQLWDHPVSSASISRDYVRTLLEKHNKNKGFAFTVRDKPGFRPEFLPLTYLAKVLSDVEEQALNPFEEQENVDARFVEETALKQTLILLGFEDK